MESTAYCGACGTALNASARFCTSCGARQDDFDEPAPQAGHSDPATEPMATDETARLHQQPRIADRIEQVTPGAGEFAGELAAQLSTPGVNLALIVAAAAAAATFVVGLVLAIALPDESALSVRFFADGDPGTITEAFAQMLSQLQVKFGYEGGSVHVAPLLLALVPLGAAAIAAATQAHLTRAMAPWARVAWAAAGGIPFVLAVVVALVVASDFEPSATAVLLGLLWVGGGGALGALIALRRDGVSLGAMVPPRAWPVLRTARAAVLPLVLALLVTSVIGLAVSYVQVLRDDPAATGDRSVPAALADSTLLALDNGVNYAALGSGAKFTAFGGSPIPVSTEELGDTTLDPGDDDGFRLFDYSEAIAPYLFIPLLIALIGAMIVAALYGGFTVARTAGARGPGMAAAYGALIGPVWSVLAVIACAMHVKTLGHPDGDSVFVTFLLGGAVLGALGGLLSASGQRAITPHPSAAAQQQQGSA